MARRQRGIATFVLIVLLISGPTMFSLGWYKVTGDPLLRPLGVTEQSMRAYYGAQGYEIVARVDWDETRSGVSKDAMRQALVNAFKVKGVEVHVVFGTSNNGTHITYRVGPSTIGPFPQARAAEGINAAVEAYRMFVPYKP